MSDLGIDDIADDDIMMLNENPDDIQDPADAYSAAFTLNPDPPNEESIQIGGIVDPPHSYSSNSTSNTSQGPRHDCPTMNNKRPPQRLRLALYTPINRNLLRKYVWNTQEVTIQDHLSKSIEDDFKLSRCHLNVQIMRIITPQGGQNGNAYTRYQRGSGQQKISFSYRTAKCCVCHSNQQLYSSKSVRRCSVEGSYTQHQMYHPNANNLFRETLQQGISIGLVQHSQSRLWLL